MNMHSIKLPRVSTRNCLFFLYNAMAYIALGLWGSQVPQYLDKPENSGQAEFTQSPTFFRDVHETWIDFKLVDNSGRKFNRFNEMNDGHTEPVPSNIQGVIEGHFENVVDTTVRMADRVVSGMSIHPVVYSDASHNVDASINGENILDRYAVLNR